MNYFRIAIINILFFVNFGLSAQVPRFGWLNDTEIGVSVAVSTSKECVYTSGSINGKYDLDPGVGEHFVNGNGLSNKTICKFDSSGKFIWGHVFVLTKTISVNTEYDSKLIVDQYDNVYFSGSFDGTVDFDPGPASFELTAEGGKDAFVCKLNAAGQLVWVHHFKGIKDIETSSIILDNANNLIATGSFGGTVNFDPNGSDFTLNNPTFSDGFVCKLTNSGSFQWAGQIEPDGKNVTTKFLLGSDKLNNIYLTGEFIGTVDFDLEGTTNNLTSSPANRSMVFICKYNPQGGILWAKNFSGTYSQCNSIFIGSQDDIFLGGMYWGKDLDFDPGVGVFSLSTSGDDNGYVCKLSSDGDFRWCRQIEGAGNSRIVSMDILLDDRIVYLSWVQGVNDIDLSNKTNWYNSSNLSQTIGVIDQNGNANWYGLISGNGLVNCRSIKSDLGEHFYVNGFRLDATDFDPSLEEKLVPITDGNLGFLLKLKPPKLNLRQDTTICTDDSLLILSGFPSYVAHKWSNGSSDTFIYAKAGTTNHLTIELGGIFYSDSVIIDEYRPVVYVGPDTAFCGEFEYRIDAKGDELITYKWNNGDVLGYTIVNDQGMYYVQAKDQYDCPNADTMNLGELQAPVIELMPDTFLCDRTILEINLEVDQLKVNYRWSTGSSNQSIIINDTGWYSVTVSIPFCESTDSIYVYSFCPPEPKIIVPNAFSPNGDGLNDVFKPIAEEVETYTMTIYNRWGEKLHSSTDGFWDGQYQGEQAQLGVYMFTISYSQKRTGIIKYSSGVVHLIH